MSKKKALLTGALSTKKALPNTEAIESITKKVYAKNESKSKDQPEKMQKTTLDLPVSLHRKAKMYATEMGITFRAYVKRLLETDLEKNGKI